ncbi:MAG: IseA DL-endopeptidase inhibitor family protein [Oscillospiraceae bacterium]|nr:IseA DL-endopeptidase inhibitor family protein [Oscillospiraceae bacterium]
MKKISIIIGVLSALLLAGCAGNKESSSLPESTTPMIENDTVSFPDSVQTTENSTTETVTVSDGSSDEIEFVHGDPIDKTALGSFVYDSALEFVKSDAEYNGLNILTENAEIYDIYARSLALSRVVFGNGDGFPSENFGEGVTFNDLSQIKVNGSDNFSCSMVTYDSFYNALTDVFTSETANQMLAQSRSFYEYEGALWITAGAGYIDTKTIHEEYEIVENSDSAFDIRITAYLVDDSRAEEYDPERADEYEKQTLHYTMLKTENGWRISDFPVYSFSADEVRRVQIAG